ncbi:hypothetical protein AK830_g8641 [Neonectria ditissima]|uniref:Transcription activator GCR1-like domain-containing protein n=1 Tax=Neonectria ditissima TaxID=78410 RepID=A0A0P7AWX9_9HYPO|nr:hypothetical protein AK830_g8641 [Neonectria ditissima]
MLPTPSPEPFALVGPSPARGPPRRTIRISAPGSSNSRPKDKSRQNDSPQKQVGPRSQRQAQHDDTVDKVSLDVATAVVNMQEHYASELEAERQRNGELQQKCEALEQALKTLERRGDAHAVLMRGFVDFMDQVKNGKFARVEGPEVEIARRMGGGYLNQVQAITSGSKSGSSPVHNGKEAGAQNDCKDVEVEGVDNRSYANVNGTMAAVRSELATRFDDIYGKLENMDKRLKGVDSDNVVQHELDLPENKEPPEDELDGLESPDTLITFDELPPSPDLSTFVAPLRSTGVRAVKRRCPPSARQHKIKRRPGMSEQEIHEWKLEMAVRDLEYSEKDQALQFTSVNSVADENSKTGVDSGRRTLRRSSRWRAINDPVSDPLVPPLDATEREKADSDYEPASDDDDVDDASTISTPHSPSPRDPSPDPSEVSEDSDIEPASPATEDPTSKPRYSIPRKQGTRVASGPPGRQFQFQGMPKTVAAVWQEYKRGLHGNPAIELLEKLYGTQWRTGTLHERKYASNYVSIRQKVVLKVEEMCEAEGVDVREACSRLDERVKGRMQLLLAALRKGQDPLKVIPKK